MLLDGFWLLITQAIVLWLALSLRGLSEHGLAVAEPLHSGDLATAREQVSRIVSRQASALDERGVAFHRGRLYCTGGSGGGNVTLMANKLAPRTFACCIDKCGMARLTDDIAFNLEGGSRLSARYSPDPESPRYLSHGAQALRYAGNPEHLAAMKHLGNTAKMIVVHGADDDVCPVQDAREMVANMEAAGLDVEAVWVTRERLDGETFTSTGHAMGDRTRIVFYAADTYLTPGSPRLVVRGGLADFERREPVRYEVPGGAYVISYENGYPVGRFERSN